MPNPADEFIRINVSGNINIYSVDGNLVESIDNYQPNQYIDISRFSSGLYVIKVNNQEKTSIHKFIKR